MNYIDFRSMARPHSHPKMKRSKEKHPYSPPTNTKQHLRSVHLTTSKWNKPWNHPVLSTKNCSATTAFRDPSALSIFFHPSVPRSPVVPCPCRHCPPSSSYSTMSHGAVHTAFGIFQHAIKQQQWCVIAVSGRRRRHNLAQPFLFPGSCTLIHLL